jgi:chromosome partitioning protein
MKREDQRVIFRELYPRGWTAVDDTDEITPGTRSTMSLVTACLEMQNLLGAILLGDPRSGAAMTSHGRATG